MDTARQTNQELELRLAEAEQTIASLQKASACASAGGNGSAGLFELEQALAASEARNLAILDASSDLMIRFDHVGTYLEFHWQHETALAPPEWFLGKRSDEVLSPATSKLLMDAVRAALATGKVQKFDFQLPTSLEEDEYCDFEARLVALGEDEVLVVCRNINERKRANKALKASELQLAQAQKTARLGSFQSSFDANFSHCSEELCNILGLPRENRTPTHKDLFNCVHPDDRRRFVSDFGNARAGRLQQRESEYRVILPNGVCRYISSNIDVVLNSHGIPMHLLGTLQDITERKLAQESLKSSEEKYRTLVETSPYCIHQIDTQGRIISMNRAGLQMLDEKDEDSIVGQLYLDRVSDEDRNLVALLLDGACQGEASEFEFRSANGLDFRSTFVPVFKSDKTVDRLLGLTQDITSLKADQLKLAASEARYRTLMKDANDAILLINAETGMLVDANQEAQEMLGRTHKEILLLHFNDVHPPNEHTNYKDLFLSRLEDGGGVLGESSVVDREGLLIPVEISASMIEMEDDRIIQGIYRNLTERRKIEKALQQKEAEIAKVSRLSTLGELTGGLAHELNQPLTAIANYVEALKDLVPAEDSENNDLHKILSSLGKTTFRTSAIISRLRGLIQKAAPHRSNMDINDLTEELLTFYLPQLEESHIQVRLELAQDLPQLHLDPIQIEQVLLNLIKNAQAAMESTTKDRRELVICTQQTENHVELSVTDSGQGLPTKNVEQLFDYFFTTTPGGLGVGLQVCRTIMESHKGSVVAQNNPRGGAIFRLSFPLSTTEINHVG